MKEKIVVLDFESKNPHLITKQLRKLGYYTEIAFQNTDILELENVKGKIDIENVSFTYEDENEVFKDLSLSIDAGKTIALVGPSGGGKTTLCNLIPRFYEITDGEILIDDTNIQEQLVDDKINNASKFNQDMIDAVSEPANKLKPNN